MKSMVYGTCVREIKAKENAVAPSNPIFDTEMGIKISLAYKGARAQKMCGILLSFDLRKVRTNQFHLDEERRSDPAAWGSLSWPESTGGGRDGLGDGAALDKFRFKTYIPSCISY